MDKFHKNQRKKELQKNKQKRAELTKIKHANQSAQAINLELLRLQKLPNSAPVLHREQKVKALAKALSERIEKGERVTEDEEGVGRTGKKKDGFVGPNSNNSNGVKQIEWERDLRDVYRAEDSVYFHPTLNPLGKPPPGKPQKYVARKREGKVDVGRALPAPGERGGGDSSSSSSDDDEDDADGNFFTRNREGVYKVEAIPGPPKGAPPPEIVMNDDDDDEASKYDDGEVLPPPIEPPPGWMPKPPPGTPPSTAFEEEDLEEVEEDDLEAIPPPPPDDDDDEEDMTVAPAPPPPPPPPPQNQTILDLEEKNKPTVRFGNTLEMMDRSHAHVNNVNNNNRAMPPPPVGMFYQRPPPPMQQQSMMTTMAGRQHLPQKQHFFSAPPPMIPKKTIKEATISGKATAISSASENPALQKLVPSHLRIQRKQPQQAAASTAAQKSKKPKIDAAPKIDAKEGNRDEDDLYLNFLDQVAPLGAFEQDAD